MLTILISGEVFGILFIWAGLVRWHDLGRTAKHSGHTSGLIAGAVGIVIGSSLLVYSSLALFNWLPRFLRLR
jgi:hypothetical protein